MRFTEGQKQLCTGKDNCPICQYEKRVKKNKNEPKSLTIINRDGSKTKVFPIKPWGSTTIEENK